MFGLVSVFLFCVVAMEKLKEEIERKRKALSENFAGRKFVRRSEIEQKELDRIREEERKELEDRRRASAKSRVSSSTLASHGSSTGDINTESLPSSSISTLKAKPILLSEEEKLDDLVLPRAEVIRRLRYLKQPITLFGEDDDMRLERIKALLKAGVTDPDTELMEGQRNDFLMDLTDMKKKERSGFLENRRSRNSNSNSDKKKEKNGGQDRGDDGGTGPVDLGAGDHVGDYESSDLENDKDSKRMKADFNELCDEDKILVFFKKLLQEWAQELEERPDTQKRTSRGKSSVATFKQCARYLNPLFKLCRKRVR